MKTKSGRKLAAKELAELESEAAAGFDLTKATPRRVGRPSLGKQGSSPRINVRVDPVAHRTLLDEAARNTTTVSDVARRALEQWTVSPTTLAAASHALSHTESLIHSLAIPSNSMATLISSGALVDLAPTFAAAQRMTLDLERIGAPLVDLYEQVSRIQPLIPRLEIFDHLAASQVAMDQWVSSGAFNAQIISAGALSSLSDTIARSAQILLPALDNMSSWQLDLRDVTAGWRTLVEAERTGGSSVPTAVEVYGGGRGVLGVSRAAAISVGVESPAERETEDVRAARKLRALLIDRLERLDGALPGKLRGAWDRVANPGPDAGSQAAHSLVEVLDWSLRYGTAGVDLLAWRKLNGPLDSDLSKDGSPTRSLKVRYICRNEPSAALTSTFVRITTEAFGSLQSVKHRGDAVDPEVVKRLIPTVEAVLIFLFAR